MLPRVLIVDDEPNIHYSFQKILGKDYDIVSAYSAADGIALLRSKSLDAVVMDIKMPGMDGLEALQKMREIDKQIPIVMMTAFGSVDTAVEAMKHGAFQYVQKPFDIEQLKGLLNKALTTPDKRQQM